jgi:predicted TIM-barrel fold metal-dependent hydrolase
MTSPAEAGRYDLPSPIAQFAGRILDLDSHENTPANLWVETFGAISKDFAEAQLRSTMITNRVKEKDDAPINAENVWKLKLADAPGAFDLDRRLEVMDFTGVGTQLLYPGSFPLLSQVLYANADDASLFPMPNVSDRKAYARQMFDAYNEWCVRVARKTDRLRPTGLLAGTSSPDELVAMAKKLVSKGVRAFLIPVDVPPGGVSPAAPALDPLWDLLASNGCPVVAHILVSREFLKSMAWSDAPAFHGWRNNGETSLDPWTLSSVHMTVQNFLNTMVLGGVFDRHPKLVFSCAEYTGHWLGPWAENMDLWVENQPFSGARKGERLRLKPSDYVRRNIRVACFPFEKVHRYIERFGFEEVYCYASDFPHHEGGKDPMGDFTRALQPLGAQILEKFFVENGKLVLPH